MRRAPPHSARFRVACNWTILHISWASAVGATSLPYRTQRDKCGVSRCLILPRRLLAVDPPHIIGTCTSSVLAVMHLDVAHVRAHNRRQNYLQTESSRNIACCRIPPHAYLSVYHNHVVVLAILSWCSCGTCEGPKSVPWNTYNTGDWTLCEDCSFQVWREPIIVD